jgi:hypothetical protein
MPPNALNQLLDQLPSILLSAGRLRQEELGRQQQAEQYALERQDRRQAAARQRDAQAISLLAEMSPKDAVSALSVFETETPYGAKAAQSVLAGLAGAAEREEEERLIELAQQNYKNVLQSFQEGIATEEQLTSAMSGAAEASGFVTPTTTIDDNPLGLDLGGATPTTPETAGIVPSGLPRESAPILGERGLDILEWFKNLSGGAPRELEVLSAF